MSSKEKTDSKYNIIDRFLEGVDRGLANSFLLIGDCGLGKTEAVLKFLKEKDYKEGMNYRFLNNYSSPLEFYNILREVNDLENPKMLLLDDCEEILASRKIVGLLRSALWGQPKRIVHWHSTSSKVQEESFEFLGRIVFLVNQLNLKNPLIKTLLSRGFYFNLTLNNREKLTLIRERAKMPYKDLSFSQRMKVVNFICEHGFNSSKLNLRMLEHGLNLFILSPNHYQELIKELL